MRWKPCPADNKDTLDGATDHAPADATAADKLAVLRSQLARLTSAGTVARREAGGGRPPLMPLGLTHVDRHLGGGLARDALHEIAGLGVDREQATLPAFLALQLIRPYLTQHRNGGACLWISPHQDLYAPGLLDGRGLRDGGIDPARLVLVATRNDQETLWAMEEALRADGVAFVIGEIDQLDLTASRRLQLAAESHGRTAVALRRQRKADPGQRGQAPIAAATRWLIRPLPGLRSSQPGQSLLRPGQTLVRPGLGNPCWRLDLWRQRNGPAGSWDITLQDRELRHVEQATRSLQTLSVGLAAALADRPLAPAANQQQDRLAATG
jgi:protein ImuA